MWLVGVGVFRNELGVAMFLFSNNVGCTESNKAKSLAILEALQILASVSFKASLVVEGDSLNVISWVSSLKFPLVTSVLVQ